MDRDCENCARYSPNGCTSWNCEFISKERVSEALETLLQQGYNVTLEYDALYQPTPPSPGMQSSGEWIPENNRPRSYLWKCSKCGGVVYYLKRDNFGTKICEYRYCPHCGIKMENDG